MGRWMDALIGGWMKDKSMMNLKMFSRFVTIFTIWYLGEFFYFLHEAFSN
jgi:hypothetical protein